MRICALRAAEVLTRKRRIWISRKKVVNLSWQSGKPRLFGAFPLFFRPGSGTFVPQTGEIRQAIEKNTKPPEKISGGLVSPKCYLDKARSAGKGQRKLYLLKVKPGWTARVPDYRYPCRRESNVRAALAVRVPGCPCVGARKRPAATIVVRALGYCKVR